MRLALTAAFAALGSLACSQPGGRGAEDKLVVFAAGSLARPLRAALDSFARHADIEIALETAGSLEAARKLTELGKIPDIIALADEEVFPQLLMPRFTSWYARFARNRLVIAYTDRSRHADSISQDSWRSVLARSGVAVGRADPDLDPAGYRTLLAFQLAERHYNDPGLARRLLANAPPRNMRAKSAELAALLDVGELDYAWEYESVARAVGHRYLVLPTAVDLSAMADSAVYSAVSVRVLGASRGDTITIAGRPIRYAVSIPTEAPNPSLAGRFIVFLLNARGQAALGGEHLEVLAPPEFVGGGEVPAFLRRDVPAATPPLRAQAARPGG